MSRSAGLHVVALLALTSGCGGGHQTPIPAPGIRMVIETDPEARGSVFVLVDASDGQPGWLTVEGPGGRVHLRERCEIADCGSAPAVCGASLPMVRDIGRGRRIETTWDGLTSVIDSAAYCERRHPVPAGEYVARFCYAVAAEFPDGGDPARGAIGSLKDPTCVERRFTLDQREVRLRVATGRS